MNCADNDKSQATSLIASPKTLHPTLVRILRLPTNQPTSSPSLRLAAVRIAHMHGLSAGDSAMKLRNSSPAMTWFDPRRLTAMGLKRELGAVPAANLGGWASHIKNHNDGGRAVPTKPWTYRRADGDVKADKEAMLDDSVAESQIGLAQCAQTLHHLPTQPRISPTVTVTINQISVRTKACTLKDDKGQSVNT